MPSLARITYLVLIIWEFRSVGPCATSRKVCYIFFCRNPTVKNIPQISLRRNRKQSKAFRGQKGQQRRNKIGKKAAVRLNRACLRVVVPLPRSTQRIVSIAFVAKHPTQRGGRTQHARILAKAWRLALRAWGSYTPTRYGCGRCRALGGAWRRRCEALGLTR